MYKLTEIPGGIPNKQPVVTQHNLFSKLRTAGHWMRHDAQVVIGLGITREQESGGMKRIREMLRVPRKIKPAYVKSRQQVCL